MTEPNEEIVFKTPAIGGHEEPVVDKADESQEEESAIPVASDEPKPLTVSKTVIPEPMTSLSPPDGHYYVDQLKNGVLLQHMKAIKPRIIFGRALDCDVVLEHPSISRYHAVLLWSPANEEDFTSGKNVNSFWYLVDCGSTHGTTCNKTPVAAGKVIKLIPNNNVFKFGASTRLFTLGTTLEESDDEEETQNNTNIAVKKPPAKEAEEDTGCLWGIDDDDAEEAGEETADSKSLQAIIAALKSGSGSETLQTDNSNAYSQNPSKSIQQWFEREGYDIEYKCDSLHNKFKCTIDLPVDGQWIPVEGSLMHRKKEAISDTCLKCCQLLDKAELFFPWQQQKRAARKRQEAEDLDSDSEMIDETIDVSKTKKFKKDGNDSSTVDDFDSLNKKWSDINEELRQLRVKLGNIGAQNQRPDDDQESAADPLDSYMANIGRKKYGLSMSDKIEKSKIKMKINTLEKDQQKLEKLIKLAKPSVHFEDPKPQEVNAVQEKPAVETEAKALPAETSNTSVTKSPSKPSSAQLKQEDKSEESKEEDRKEEIRRKTEAIINDLKNSSKPKSQLKPSKQRPNAQQSIVEAIEREKKAEKVGKSKEQIEYDSDYVDWLPPTDQTGDGKTSLNQKLGY